MIDRWLGYQLLGLLVLSSSAWLSRCFAADDSGEIARPIRAERELEFRLVGDAKLTADLYRPDDERVYPLVIMIHGGGWSSGDKWNVRDHAREMAQAGFVALSINYRLAPRNPMADQIEDCRAALCWAKEHAGEWQADASKLCLWGYSAGAHLAAWMATDPKPGEPKIKAVVAGGAPCDFEFIPLNSISLVHVLGGTRAEVPEAYADASPLKYASADDAPFFFFHGDTDLIVPDSSSRKMFEKLQELRVEAEYHSVKSQGHLLTFINPEARRLAINFLRKHTTEGK